MLFSHELVFTLVPGSMQLTYKKYLILITYLSKIYITECISQGHRQKNGRQKHIKTNLHLDQQWCFHLYSSLALCNSTTKKYLVLIIHDAKICITRENLYCLHLNQEWCPDDQSMALPQWLGLKNLNFSSFLWPIWRVIKQEYHLAYNHRNGTIDSSISLTRFS